MSETVPASEPPPGRRSRRRFRLWEKKRGTRQTGSSRWGAVGEIAFFAGLFLLGVMALTELVSLRLIWNTDSFFTSNSGLLLGVFVLGTFTIVGAVGAIYSVVARGTSAERRAAIAKRATDNELLAEVQQRTRSLPTIPSDTNWKNSPGIRLAYRLPTVTLPSWRLVIVASFCLLWNGAVGVLSVLAFNQRDIDPIWSFGWWTTFRVVVLIYAVIGIVAINQLLRMLVEATSVGPTSVEVSALPLHPGRQYEIFLTQAGHLQFDWLELTLVCDEEVTYSDGTDTRSETKRVVETKVLRQEDFNVSPSQPFECEGTFELPDDAMHSFVTANNAVIWKLIARLQPRIQPTKSSTLWNRIWRPLKIRVRRILKTPKPAWPTIERVYPLVLYPAQDSLSTHPIHGPTAQLTSLQ